MSKVIEYTWLEFKLLFRIPIGLFFTIFFPIMLLATLVVISGNKPVYEDYYFVDIYLPIAMLVGMFSAGIISFSIIVAGNRSQKHWQTYRLRGFKIYQIIISQLFVNIVLCLVSTMVLAIFAVSVFSAKVPSLQTIAGFAPVWLLSAFSVFMIGFVIGVGVKTEKTAQAISTPIMFILLIASGIMVNFESFPETIQDILKYLPTTQANWMLVSSWNQSFNDGNPILWWITVSWITVSLAFVVFRLYRDNFRRI